jgi:hypothetical protein
MRFHSNSFGDSKKILKPFELNPSASSGQAFRRPLTFSEIKDALQMRFDKLNANGPDKLP